jgi:chitinase
MSTQTGEKPLTSKYQRYRDFHEEAYSVGVVDDDGAVLHEEPYGSLLDTIVQHNDVAKLAQYLENNANATHGHVEVYYWDPFYVAAQSGSTEALNMLLKHYENHLNDTNMIPLHQRQFRLLHIACLSARVETALFLLDTQPALATLHDRPDSRNWDMGCGTPLLSTAYSFAHLPPGSDDDDSTICAQHARSEDLMSQLLDRGASARDSLVSVLNEQQISDTVLSLAISRASYGLLKRLIVEGADVHAKTTHDAYFFSDQPDENIVQSVTPLHLASFYANIDGIQALFDYHGDKVTVAQMVLSNDSAGHLPLHWAARGAAEHDYMLPRNEIVTHVTETIKLLLSINPDTVNARDHQGFNALWYTVYGFRESINNYSTVLKTLFDYRPDGSIRDQDGKNMLHLLAFTQNGEATDPAIIEALVAYGANVNNVDARGNTPLNQMAMNLRQVAAVRALLDSGASVMVKNLRGDTPLHQSAQGRVFPYRQEPPNIEWHGVSLDDKIKAQDEMMKVLEEASDGLDLMNGRNADGKTAQQLKEETRSKWRLEESERLSRMSSHELWPYSPGLSVNTSPKTQTYSR